MASGSIALSELHLMIEMMKKYTAWVFAFGLVFFGGCGGAKSDGSAPGGWVYPGAFLQSAEQIDGYPGVTRHVYASPESGEAVKQHFIRHFSTAGWSVERVETHREPENSFFNSVVSVMSPDENETVQIALVEMGENETEINLSHVPDIKAVIEARLAGETQVMVHGEKEPMALTGGEAAESAVPGPSNFSREIQQFVNDGDYDALYQLGSKTYQKSHSPSLFADRLSGTSVESFVPRVSSLRDNLCIQVIDYRITRDDYQTHGLAVMYWTLKDGRWGYENLPVLRLGEVPQQILEAFE